MHVLHPEFFLLIPAFIVLGWFWRGLHLHRPLRVLLLLIGVALLTRPEIRQAADGLDLWVLVDRSASAANKVETSLGEWQNLLEKSRGRHDRLHFVDFAEEALLRSEGDGTSVFPGNKNATRIAGAIRHTLAKLDPNRPSRLLVLTDGNSTEPLDGLTERLVRESVALDYRLIVSDTAGDWSIQNLTTPARVREGEAFLFTLTVSGPDGQTAPLEIYRDGQRLGQSEVTTHGGEARLRFTDRLTGGGAHRYEARLLAPDDPLPGNNTAISWVESAGGPRSLLITAYADDPLAAVLRAQGTQVEVITDPSAATFQKLSGAKLVVLNNVPAYRLCPDFLDSLALFVTTQGGGLLMGGGRTSYAAGGYFGSPAADILPVSMELRQEHRKLALAMVIALDRSGSMSANMPGTNMQKMDLANNGAAEAIQLLGDMDSVAVYAVDTQAHEMAPLSTVGSDRKRLVEAAKRIQSAGGGICVPTALRAAHETLKKSPAGRRHIIVFADANDATQELGDYPALIKSMRADGITISIIGMGQATDSGGHFLQEVAKLGEGRIFFNENPAQLTAMFSQETVAVARSAFLSDPVPLTATPGWLEIAARPLNWLPAVDAYNLCYLKPNATAAALSNDEYKAPLTAFWQRGAGRTAAVTFPLGGDFSKSVLTWPAYGDFLQTLTRWLEGDKLPPGAALHYTVDGTRLRVDFRHDDTWLERLSKAPPRLLAATGVATTAREVSWEKIAPGHYHADLELPAGQWLRGAVSAGGFALPFGPVSTAVNPEWANNPARIEALRSLSKASGGVERVDMSSAWKAERRLSWIDASLWLLLAWVVFFLVEVLQTRTGFGITPRSAKA
ncbi:MAG: VWA domain-containing protein [Puniceicoccales bacterium]|jgi:Mg-chelatase subunit ChlD|nr:VWA domain-containing protein [Puniceicoccales bacterium]